MFWKEQPQSPVAGEFRTQWTGKDFVIFDSSDNVVLRIRASDAKVVAALPAGAIAAADIADGAVTEGKIGSNAVSNTKMAAQAVRPENTSGVAVLYNLGAPLLADDDAVCASQVMKNGDYTLEAAPDPDIPRNITIKRTVVGGADTPGTITVNGTNYQGVVISEEIIPGNDGVTVAGNSAFKSVTSVVGAGWIPDDPGDPDTLEVGWGNKLGCHAPTNDTDDIMLGILGVTITAHNPAVGGAANYHTTTVDMSAGVYDGVKAALVFQRW